MRSSIQHSVTSLWLITFISREALAEPDRETKVVLKSKFSTTVPTTKRIASKLAKNSRADKMNHVTLSICMPTLLPTFQQTRIHGTCTNTKTTVATWSLTSHDHVSQIMRTSTSRFYSHGAHEFCTALYQHSQHILCGTADALSFVRSYHRKDETNLGIQRLDMNRFCHWVHRMTPFNSYSTRLFKSRANLTTITPLLLYFFHSLCCPTL